MVKNACGVCQEKVTNKSGGVACTRCEMWFHVPCAGMKDQDLKVLSNKYVVFLCETCLVRTQEEWKERETKNNCSQTENNRMIEAETQADLTKEPGRPARNKVQEVTDQPDVAIVNEARRMTGPKKKSMVVKRAPIRSIGDSMIRQLPDHVQLSKPGSGCISMGGARIQDVKRKVRQEAEEMEDGTLLIIQGGGNDLERTGSEETVQQVMEAVKAVEGKKMSVAVVGVMRRPREGRQYEQLRRMTNEKICLEVTKTKMEWMTKKNGNVSFIDLDGILKEDRFYARDGVHLNATGAERMGRRLREWVRARSLHSEDVV